MDRAEVGGQTQTGAEPGALRPWDRYLTDAERAVLRRSGYGAHQGFGERPALLVIDVTVGFVGGRGAGARSNETNPDSCGEAGWQAIEQLALLLAGARAAEIPIIYTRGLDPTPDPIGAGRWADKNSRWFAEGRRTDALEIVPEIAPEGEELVLDKARPSAFFGTPLLSLLIDYGVDSLLVCGTTTSGCVRATVLDAFSLNYRVSVVEECTFDRIEASHAVGLLDMDLKYADVVSLAETETFLGALSNAVPRAALR